LKDQKNGKTCFFTLQLQWSMECLLTVLGLVSRFGAEGRMKTTATRAAATATAVTLG